MINVLVPDDDVHTAYGERLRIGAPWELAGE